MIVLPQLIWCIIPHFISSYHMLLYNITLLTLHSVPLVCCTVLYSSHLIAASVLHYPLPPPGINKSIGPQLRFLWLSKTCLGITEVLNDAETHGLLFWKDSSVFEPRCAGTPHFEVTSVSKACEARRYQGVRSSPLARRAKLAVSKACEARR